MGVWVWLRKEEGSPLSVVSRGSPERARDRERAAARAERHAAQADCSPRSSRRDQSLLLSVWLLVLVVAVLLPYQPRLSATLAVVSSCLSTTVASRHVRGKPESKIPEVAVQQFLEAVDSDGTPRVGR